MDIWTQIQFLTVPKWLRNLVVIMTILLVGICAYMFYYALTYSGDGLNWMEAGAYLTGIVFPITLIIIFVAGVQTGVESIQKKIDVFLMKTMPDILRKIPEQQAGFIEFNSEESQDSFPSRQEAKILISHVENHCYADYQIIFKHPDGYMMNLPIRPEVNVKRVNLCIYVDPDHIAKLAGLNRADPDFVKQMTEYLYKAFQGTIFGAQMDMAIRKNNRDKNISQVKVEEGYKFNSTLLKRIVDGREYYAMVASTRIAEDMLWHSAETLFFTQDLMFMLRAIAYEAPEVFRISE